jgi:HCOMODA/2-hydroxy-3-carboxy-muconic semialdehyde decarboxylase
VSDLSELLYELAIANRIVANEGVLDAFGHVSMRHPSNPDRYFLSRSRSPELVEVADIYEYDLDSQPVKPPPLPMYSERVIHGEIYKARPDVMAVCHHHSPAILPYCITGEKLVPVYHLGAVIGIDPPFWDQHDEFGDTNMLVQKPEEGASLARALGNHSLVLMRRHGATVASSNLRELVFRTIYGARNAEYQTQAKAIGNVTSLSRGETEMAGALPKQPNTTSRAWEYWVVRLDKAGGMPPKISAARKVAASMMASRKPAKKKAAVKKKAVKTKGGK